MIAILSLFIVIVGSILVIRVATIALVQTGLSHEIAKFQARSAFSGAGFTTRESEQITGHPLRRKIISSLMLWGSAGVVTAISSLVLSFVAKDSQQAISNLVIIAGGILLLFTLSKSDYLDRKLNQLIKILLNKYSDIDITDYEDLLRVKNNYTIAEVKVNEQHSFTNKTIAEAKLLERGVIILGIDRHGESFIGTPNGQVQIINNDRLLIYGKRSYLLNLSGR